MTRLDWHLECPACATTAAPDGLPSLCTACGHPWEVRYPAREHPLADREAMPAGGGMWRFRAFLPVVAGEEPVSLGEGDTPLLGLRRTADRFGFRALWVKDEACNQTGSFKARGLSAAVTRGVAAGATRFVVPTAGNAGVALSAYAARAGAGARVYAPRTTPREMLTQMRWYGAELILVDGHIGDCGKLAAAYAAETGALNVATLREPYRLEGNKTLGLELAMQLGWRLPDVVLYPTGGGEGLLGMWKAFQELQAAGWVGGHLPRLYAVQSTGCAPVVRALAEGAERCEPWADPWTVASGLRVPGPIGDRMMLRALRASGGGAVAVDDEALTSMARTLAALEGLDWSPEGGAAMAALLHLVEDGRVDPGERIVVFNTGAGWLYREPLDLPEAEPGGDIS